MLQHKIQEKQTYLPTTNVLDQVNSVHIETAKYPG